MTASVVLDTQTRSQKRANTAQVPERGQWRSLAQRLTRDRATLLALGALMLVALLALLADFLATHFFLRSPNEQDLVHAFAEPDLRTPALWFGSDELGRSEIVRLLFGARVSMGVAVGAGLINVAVAVPVGLVAGYQRGVTDDLVQWAVATLYGIPRIFLLVLIASLFGPGPLVLVVVLGLLSWPGIALFVRGQTLVLRQKEFILAARVVGASDTRILMQHLLPNVLPLVVVLSTIEIGALILAESALSFLGLGIQPPMPSWGNLLTNAAAAMERAPWLVWGPGASIFLMVLSLYLLGDGLRDALDPRHSAPRELPSRASIARLR